VVPLATLTPVGVDTTVSPLRPVAETVTLTFCGGGGGGAAGVTVSTDVRVMPLYVAEIVTDRVAETVDVVTVNPDAVDPPATVTVDGTPATAASLVGNVTTAPPAGAPADRETKPDVLVPPATLDGLIVTLFNETPAPAGVMVSVADRVEPL